MGGHVEARGQFAGTGSLWPIGSWGLNSGSQAWQVVSDWAISFFLSINHLSINLSIYLSIYLSIIQSLY